MLKTPRTSRRRPGMSSAVSESGFRAVGQLSWIGMWTPSRSTSGLRESSCWVEMPAILRTPLLRLRTRLLRLKTRLALVMQLVGGWPDGPCICLYMLHILYLVAKLFEECSINSLMLSISYAVIQYAIRPDMVISVIYPPHDIYSTRY